MEPDVWEALAAQWMRLVGDFEEVAVYERIQASRTGFAVLLLRGGDPVAFVKVREGDAAPLQTELEALDAMEAAKPAAFEVPRAIAWDGLEGWHYLVTTAFRAELHRVPHGAPVADIVDEIRSGLQVLPRPGDTPSHWEPMHGDFTPWNLRQRSEGRFHLVDWEDAGWAPPGADEMFFWAALSVVSGRGAVVLGDEARGFWLDRLERRRLQADVHGDDDVGLLFQLIEQIR